MEFFFKYSKEDFIVTIDIEVVKLCTKGEKLGSTPITALTSEFLAKKPSGVVGGGRNSRWNMTKRKHQG